MDLVNSKNHDEIFKVDLSDTINHSEVTTPHELRIQSLSKIPVIFWEIPRKIIEPSCGKGGYLIDIIYLCMNGLIQLYPNTIDRYKFIVEECIYFSDINSSNIEICKSILDPHNKYKLNYNIGDTIGLDVKKKWNIDGFDLHVCNPPFEDIENGVRKALNKNLWSEFLDWSYKYLLNDGYMLYITPPSWMSPAFKKKHIFYNNHIIYLNIAECRRHFEIPSLFSYYLIQKTNTIGKTTVECEYKKKVYKSECNLNGMVYLPYLTTNHSINIIKKFMKNKLNKISFSTSCELHNTTYKDKLQDYKDDVFIYPVRHTAKRNIRYSCQKHSLQDKNKILMNLSGNLHPIFDEKTMGMTQAQLYLLTDDKNYVDILNSRLYQFVFKICKWSGFNIKNIYLDIPYISELKTDDELYGIFKLTKSEIDLIESIDI